MTSRPRIALGFLHPDFDPGGATGLHLNAAGGLATVGGAQSVRQSILLLVSTRPGERLLRPDYGCDLQRVVFAPNDATTAGLAAHYVRQAVARFEPGAEVLTVDAHAGPEAPDRLVIVMEYRVRATQEVESLQIALSLMGSA